MVSTSYSEPDAAADSDWDPQLYARHAAFVPDLGRSLVEWLAPRPGERILDLGCGDGVLTEELVKAGSRVIGVDSSPRQVEAARRRGLAAVVSHGENLHFQDQFDAVFSNAALHWMQRPDAVLHGVRRALRPGGRFVAEFGAYGNVATICAALSEELHKRGHEFRALNPWYFPHADEYRAKLVRAGFQIVKLTTFDRPTPLPGDLTGWLETFAQSFTIGWSPQQRTELFTAIQERVRPQLWTSQGKWMADYVRLRLHVIKSPPTTV